MNNYQLYRTNLLLGGQMKWDIIVDDTNGTLVISDFHLTPISDNTSYISKNDEYLVNTTHQDNIRMYYNTHKDIFYKECLDAEFSNSWPTIVTDSNDNINMYSNTFDAGCKRAKLYSKYNKQFEIFCPLWLEHLDGELSFDISIKTPKSGAILASKKLVFNTLPGGFHSKFVQYFNNYINDLGINGGTDDLININFKDNTATVTGLNVKYGILETKNIDDIITNLIMIERPLMETDHIITKSFEDNLLICKQLFNFNICFNIDDILSGGITNILSGDEVTVSIKAYINGNELEKQDFYTEYEYINREVYNDVKTNKIKANVLDYLNDYKCIDLIDKNKFAQYICHWSLCENPNYIFNVYEGFSGLYVLRNKTNNLNFSDEYIICENEHQYGNATNTHVKQHDIVKNTVGWCNNTNILSWNNFYKYIKNTNKYKTQGVYISNNQFVNNIKYNYLPKTENGVYILGMVMSDSLLSTITSNIECINLYNDCVYVIYKDNFLMILTNDINYLSFAQFYNILHKYINADNHNDNIDELQYILNEIFKMFASVVQPALINIYNTLVYTNANSPSELTDEIIYYKDEKTSHYVIRYDGKIKPSFIDKDRKNTLYYKDSILKDANNTIYSNYSKTNYEPLYPSINYCAIKSLTDWNYDNAPSIINDIEYSWFDDNICLLLKPELKLTYIKHKDNIDININDIIRKCIGEFYNTSDDKKLDMIISKYDIQKYWDYISDTDLSQYKYNIYCTLK